MLILRLAARHKQVNLVLTVAALLLLLFLLEHLCEPGLEHALLQGEADHGRICGQLGHWGLMWGTELANTFLFISEGKVVLLRLVGIGFLHLEVASILERLHSRNGLNNSGLLSWVGGRVEIRCSIHLLYLLLSADLQSGLVHQALNDALHYALPLAVKHDCLHAEHCVCSSLGIIVADVVVKELDQHIGQPRALLGRTVDQKHARLHQHDTLRRLVLIVEPVDEEGLQDPAFVYLVLLMGDEVSDECEALQGARVDHLVGRLYVHHDEAD